MNTNSDNYVKMMQTWVDTAKAFTQLATAVLMLPVFFLRDILGVAKDNNAALGQFLNPWIYASWVSLGTCIIIGLVYQTIAARLMGDALVGTQSHTPSPRWTFHAMIAAFAAGILFFLVGVRVSTP